MAARQRSFPIRQAPEWGIEPVPPDQRRLGFLRDVGLDYLTLDRLSSTLSGGEAQRIVFQGLVRNPLIVLAPDAVYPLPPCHFIAPARFAWFPYVASKPRTKIYVAILRCNIRDPTYLCSAQFWAILA